MLWQTHMHNTRGFTLIEALIAAAVLGLGMLGVSQLAMHSLHASASSHQQATALGLAQSAVECWRSGPVLCPASAAWSTGSQGVNSSTRQGTVYSVSATVTPTAYTPLQALQVTVTWKPTAPNTGSSTANPMAHGAGQIQLFTRAASTPVFVPLNGPQAAP